MKESWIKMNEQKKWRIGAYVLIVLIMAILIFLVIEFNKIGKDGLKCQSNPFVFGAQQVAKKEEGITCSCITNSGTSMIFSQEGIKYGK